MSITISKSHLAAGVAASTDKIRPILTYIKISADAETKKVTSVGTDSFMLLEVQVIDPDVSRSEEAYLSNFDIKGEDLAFKQDKDNEAHKLRYFSEQEGKLPDYQHVIPKGEPTATVLVNVELLKQLLKGFEKEKQGSNLVELSFFPGNQPLVIKAKRKNATITGLLMPVKA